MKHRETPRHKKLVYAIDKRSKLFSWLQKKLKHLSASSIHPLEFIIIAITETCSLLVGVH